MRVVITGGSGFIGQNLALYLNETEPETEIVLLDIVSPEIELGENTSFVYGDIRNLNCLITAFRGADEVYHLAGILGTSELIGIASMATDVNITGAANVFDAVRICGVKRVYNVAKPHFEGYEENAYTLTKHAGELLGLMYRDKYGINVATVRWLNAVGAYQHVYPVRKFLPMMVLLALYNKDLEIYGTGNQTIAPIDTRDLARFTVHDIRNLGQHKEVVDLGSGKDITCNDAALLIRNEVSHLTGYECTSEIVNIPMREGEADDANLKADMSYWDSVGMKTEVDFKTSIRSTIRYMMDKRETHLTNALKFFDID